MVTFIREDGLLKMTAAGGINLQVMAGRPVAIDTVHGLVPGVIGAKPIHLLDEEERGKAVPLKDLYIDIGAASREEAAALVSPGDRVVFRSVWDESHGRLKARALDDRAGCALLVDLMKKDLQYDMTFVLPSRRRPGRADPGQRRTLWPRMPQLWWKPLPPGTQPECRRKKGYAASARGLS